MGIGLNYVKRMLESQYGDKAELRIQSVIGKGTTIFVTIPILRGTAVMIKVMIVDDDKLVRKGLISAMPWGDFDMEVVGEASNGEKALEFIADHAVDLLLTDLSMPVMSGIELLKVVRKQYPNMYTVVLTFHQDFEYIKRR